MAWRGTTGGAEGSATRENVRLQTRWEHALSRTDRGRGIRSALCSSTWACLCRKLAAPTRESSACLNAREGTNQQIDCASKISRRSAKKWGKLVSWRWRYFARRPRFVSSLERRNAKSRGSREARRPSSRRLDAPNTSAPNLKTTRLAAHTMDKQPASRRIRKSSVRNAFTSINRRRGSRQSYTFGEKNVPCEVCKNVKVNYFPRVITGITGGATHHFRDTSDRMHLRTAILFFDCWQNAEGCYLFLCLEYVCILYSCRLHVFFCKKYLLLE